MTEKDFLERFKLKLTDQQAEVMRCVDGPVVVSATAGAGKTTTLVARVGYMIHVCGINPQKILVLTYTVAAAHDMEARFESIFGTNHKVEFRTINGICQKILNRYEYMSGKKAYDLVSDEGEILKIIARCYQKITRMVATESELKELRTLIAYIKNSMLTDEEIGAFDADPDYLSTYIAYQKEMAAKKRIDFDDQLVYSYKILTLVPDMLNYISMQYPYIICDESQDNSKVQIAIMELLSQKSGNLCLIGDDDQSIYRFRAACPKAMIDFGKTHRNARSLFLEYNFRSNAYIVESAGEFISKNKQRTQKTIRASRPYGSSIDFINIKTRAEQYDILVRMAEKATGETAVLFRNNEQALPVINILEQRGIPFNVKNKDLSFFSHKIVRDLTDFINYACAPSTETLEKIYYKFNLYLSKQSMDIVKLNCAEGVDPLYYINKTPESITQCKKGTKNSADEMRYLFEKIRRCNASEAIKIIRSDLGYDDYTERAHMDTTKLDIVEHIAKGIGSARELLGRLDELHELLKKKEYDNNASVVFTTIHSAKGLEWDTVYVMDAVEGVFPVQYFPPNSYRIVNTEELEDYEEERRLFFVAVTRAKNCLHLFKIRTASGAEYTPFVAELERYYRRITSAASGGGEYRGIYNIADYDEFVRLVSVPGTPIEHVKFGKGIIVAADGNRVQIKFGADTRMFLITMLLQLGLIYKT